MFFNIINWNLLYLNIFYAYLLNFKCFYVFYTLEKGFCGLQIKL